MMTALPPPSHYIKAYSVLITLLLYLISPVVLHEYENVFITPREKHRLHPYFTFWFISPFKILQRCCGSLFISMRV
jgi:hypothetical protein